ncbi:MAG: restriction endonuclease subunit S [Bacteroidales bacterium]|nr:restriction endonuclease subunit S [Bacteroidales bacterium]
MHSSYPTYKLVEVIDKVAITSKVKQKEYLADGKFPIIDQGQDLIGGYSNDEKQLVNAELPVIVFGDHTKVKKYIDFPFVAGADGTKIIKPKKDFFIEQKLFYWFLHCVKFPDKGYARHFQYLLKSDIAVPPLPTQHAIVTRIETLFAELDKGVEKLKTAQQQLKVYRQAVLNDCLTKGSEKWEKVKLKDICLSISDGDHLPPKRTDKGVPFITISDIKGNSIDFSNVSYMTEEYYENLSQSRKAKVGDILYTVTGSYGIPVLVENNIKFCFQRHIGLIRPNSTTVKQRWLYYMMQSPIIYSQATEKSTGTAQKTVTLSVLRDFELCLPPLPEQQRIVQEIETRLSQAELVEASIEQSLQQAEALRQSILKKAFSGELVKK